VEDTAVTRFARIAVFTAFVLGVLWAHVENNPPADAQEPNPYGQPMYAQPEPNRADQDARTDAATIVSALQYGILPGCPVVGGHEDGGIVAYCAETDVFISRGGNATDAWAEYHGPVTRTMLARVACMDGRTPRIAFDCAADAIIRAYLVAGPMPVSAQPQP
jgi:hypothetical protein